MDLGVPPENIAELTQAGKTKFHHRSGKHDDRLWALVLAVYGYRFAAPSYHPYATFGHVVPGTVETILRKRTTTGLPIPWPLSREHVGY